MHWMSSDVMSEASAGRVSKEANGSRVNRADFTQPCSFYRPSDWILEHLLPVRSNGLWQGYLFRKEFASSHGPKIVVRRFQYRPRTPDREPGVEFVIANVGESKAKIVLDNVTVKILTANDMHTLEQNSFPLYEGAVNVLAKRVY